MTHRLTPLLLLALLCAIRFVNCESDENSIKISVDPPILKMEATGEELGPQYQLKSQTVSVTCKHTKTNDDFKLSWDVRKDERYTISETEEKASQLNIEKFTEDDIQTLTCNLIKEDGEVETSKSTSVSTPPIITIKANSKPIFDYDFTPDGGDTVELKCELSNNDNNNNNNNNTSFRWFRIVDGEEKDVKEEFKTDKNDELRLPKNLVYEKDRGILGCTAINLYGNNTVKMFLRVKNPSAFVVPLVAIVVEVVLIVVIVIAYEISMRKKRAAAANSDPKTD